MSTAQPGSPVIDAAAAPGEFGFRDPTTLTRWLRIFLCIGMALSAMSFLSGLMELTLLSDIEAGKSLAPGVADSNDLRQRIIAGVRFVNIVVVIVLFAVWIYRANYNARQLGAVGMEFTPGWAVGWYFIPFANLWKPYQAMREIWKASAAPANWQDQPRGSILPWWWTFFLLSNIFSQIALRMTMRASTLPEMVAASSLSTASDFVDVISASIALVVVGQIYRMQMAHQISASTVPAISLRS